MTNSYYSISKTLNFSLIAGLIGLSHSAHARPQNLECNKAQNYCEVEDRSLIIGDRVGVINHEDELVASGEVQGIDGPTRKIKIKKRYGVIKVGYKLVALDGRPEEGTKAQNYRAYQEPTKHSVGGSIGLSTYSIGIGSPGIEATAYYQQRFWQGAQWIVRGNYLNITGVANRYTDFSVEDVKLNVSAFSLLGGGVYTFRENRPVSIRTEFSLGGTSISASADGDKELLESELKKSAKVKNGIAPYVRWSLGAVWNASKEWNALGEVSQCLLNEAYGTTFGVGFARILE